ncbi:enoyl-CoA hydratase/isomerase family protein [Blastococcus sp. SYSU DS0973]
MQADLVEQFLRVVEDGVRAVVLTGNGPAFCAGFDLEEIRAADERGERFRPPMNRPARAVCEVVTETPVPVIAALNGSAVAGGGLRAGARCDLRIASPAVHFALPEAAIGMGANFGSVVLPKRIPVGIALERLFTGVPIDAAEAQRWGLLNRLVDPEDVLPTALGLADRSAANAPVRRMKETAVKAPELLLWQACGSTSAPTPTSARTARRGSPPAWRSGRRAGPGADGYGTAWFMTFA